MLKRRPPCLFIPGWAVASSACRPFLDILARHVGPMPEVFDFHEIAVSSPAVTSDPAAISSYARALGDRLATQPAPSLLVGWSTGALIALEAAHHFPERVDRLILLSGTACFCTSEGYPCGTPEAQLRALQRGIRSADPARVLADFFARVATPRPGPPPLAPVLIEQALHQGIPALEAGLRYVRTADARSFLATLRPSLLAVHGDHDAVIPATAAEWMCAHAPRATSIRLPDAGHALPLLHAEDTVAAMIRYLDKEP